MKKEHADRLGRIAPTLALSDEARAEMVARTLITLTRAQMRLLVELRECEMVFTEGLRRSTIDMLAFADLAYETSTGQLRLSADGRNATILTSRRVLLPAPEPTSCVLATREEET